MSKSIKKNLRIVGRELEERQKTAKVEPYTS